ncbi:tripartite tricarboxylate transporter substrate-binding protein [Solwaraspora sp. WMMD937]|uniref:Bug family tripartite tricarboxylate transporter substrate binding protein n=1 Tax=Solwaraspora sp. WMMD937 TaxID=3016090 RepID=UPI00249AB469|nr:tripartite tricarboxylate transporter substrate-binding protein [Solwaraspora sp. WMMD937]WFE19961.1 tripartite tricarboxylate transporter substrate-binding protein [Solwaraspora sp. WMMD937]
MAAATSVVVALTGCQAAGGDAASEADYPTDRITFLSGFEPGGGIDLAINTTIQALKADPAVTVPMGIDHLPGGSGLIAAEKLGRSPEGTDDILQLTSISSLTTSLQKPDDFQITELTPVALLFKEYSTMYVRADSDLQTVDDVARRLSEDASSLTFAGGSLGSPSNLAIARFTTAVGVPFDQVSYLPLSGGETELALLGGNADVISGGLESMQFVEKGDFRALAISAAERVAAAPDVPTYTESGYEVVQGSWRGVFAPPTMGQPALDFWYAALERAVQADSFQQAAQQYGWEVDYLAGDDFADFLDEEAASLQGALETIGLINS